MTDSARSGLRPIPLARPPEFVVCPLMREIRAFRYFWPISTDTRTGSKSRSPTNRSRLLSTPRRLPKRMDRSCMRRRERTSLRGESLHGRADSHGPVRRHHHPDLPHITTRKARGRRPTPLLDARGYRGDLSVGVCAGIFRVRDQPIDRPALDLIGRPRPLISGPLCRVRAPTRQRGKCWRLVASPDSKRCPPTGSASNSCPQCSQAHPTVTA